MKYLIVSVLLIAVALYFFRNEFFEFLGFVENMTSLCIDWMTK